MCDDFETSELWIGILGELQEWNDEYAKGGYPLLVTFEPALVTKPYASFLMKTFRKNCVRNVNWPDEPPGGWLLPDNWYSRENDLVRTFLVVKYLDGVEFAMEKLRAYGVDHGVEAVATLEARIEGYYAAQVMRTHLHEYYDERRLQKPIDLVDWQWNYRSSEFSTGYLAHILHYVEGMIVEIRDKQRKERP
jgi:hypothetical protein